MTQRRRRRLALRVYAFAGALSVAIMIALIAVPRFVRTARYLEPQAALMQYMVERWSLQEPRKFAEAMVRVDARVRGTLVIYDAAGTVLHRSSAAMLREPTVKERAILRTEKWALSTGRIVVRSDDGKLVAVYGPTRPSFPWGWVLPACAAMLVLVGAASIWFARRLALPLDQLATAARSFGKGDITARARLERQDELGDVGRAFDDMAERTSAVMQSQRQLMADVSHELRTPLARIRVALELAAEDPVAAKDVLTDVNGDLDEIDTLIGDILTTARLDGEQAKVSLRHGTVAALAQKAIDRFTARNPRRKLEAELADRELECDPILLRRALDNLLDNAAKYSEPGTPVRLTVVPSGARVAFEIRDLGIGMSADELEHAFTPFWRADGSRTRRTGGVGLGLALARRIARAHGGDVTLDSSPGQGTTARLEVPLHPPKY